MQVGLALIQSRAEDILGCKSFMEVAELFQDLGSKCVDYSELMVMATSSDIEYLLRPKCIHMLRRDAYGTHHAAGFFCWAVSLYSCLSNRSARAL